MPFRQAWLNRCRLRTSVFWSLQPTGCKESVNSHSESTAVSNTNISNFNFKMLAYLKTVRSSSEMAMAYCSVGWVTINLLQHLSLLSISWALSYFKLLLLFLLVHFEHFGPPALRLLPGRAVSGLGSLGAIILILIPRLPDDH